MSTIKYTNDLYEEVSFQEAQQLDIYNEIVEDDNKNLVNTYKNGKLINTNYSITSYEEMDELLRSNPYASFSVYSFVNNYSVYDMLDYLDNQVKSKIKIVNDNSGNTICFQKYDPKTELPNYLDTDKSYYDASGLEIYKFVYNADGSCFSIDRVQLIEPGSEFMAKNIGTDHDINFTWKGFEYYQNAEPLIPHT